MGIEKIMWFLFLGYYWVFSELRIDDVFIIIIGWNSI